MAAELGKPVLAIILTHAHPDHYGGVAIILKEHPNTLYHDEVGSKGPGWELRIKKSLA